MPEETLHEAVTELRHVIQALTELIQREYPTRDEMEKKYVKKETSRRRWYAILLTLAIAFPVSMFTTVGVVSGCFLNAAARTAPVACNLVPGFEETRDYNTALIEEFELLQNRSVTNEERIKRLEEQNQ